jgi:hypothetical protein
MQTWGEFVISPSAFVLEGVNAVKGMREEPGYAAPAMTNLKKKEE